MRFHIGRGMSVELDDKCSTSQKFLRRVVLVSEVLRWVDRILEVSHWIEVVLKVSRRMEHVTGSLAMSPKLTLILY